MFKLGFVGLVSIFLVTKNVLGLTDEQKAKISANILELGIECVKEHPITSEDVMAFREKTVPKGENVDCFISCLLKKTGIMDDSGNLSQSSIQERAKEIFTDEDELKNIDDFITTCITVNDEEVSDGEKGCDRAKLAYECLVKNSSKFGFSFDF